MLNFKRNKGASLAEFVVIFPVFAILGLGTFQWTKIYQIQNTLNHATFMAARAGSLHNADPDVIKGVMAEYLAPLYAPDSTNTTDISLKTGAIPSVSRGFLVQTCPSATAIHSDLTRDLACHDLSDGLTGHSRMRIINPTIEAFEDFGEDIDGDGKQEEIPNTDLNLRSTAQGSESGVNIQDANILKIEITYMPRLKVPFVNYIFAFAVQSFAEPGSFEDLNIEFDSVRFPFRSTATVRMQTPAVQNDKMLTRQDAEDLVDGLLEDSNRRIGFTSNPFCGPTGDLCDGNDGDPIVSPCGIL